MSFNNYVGDTLSLDVRQQFNISAFDAVIGNPPYNKSKDDAYKGGHGGKSLLAFSQVWIGGKGMGIQMKLVQCIVKPREVVSSIGKCQINLSDEEMDTLTSGAEETPVVVVPVSETITAVCDSDDEKEEVLKPVVVKKVIKKLAEPVVVVVPEPVVVVVPEPIVVVVPEPVVDVVPAPAPVAVKKIIKKSVVHFTHV